MDRYVRRNNFHEVFRDVNYAFGYNDNYRYNNYDDYRPRYNRYNYDDYRPRYGRYNRFGRARYY